MFRIIRYQLTVLLFIMLLEINADKNDLTQKFHLKRDIFPMSVRMKNFFDRTIDNYSTEKSGFLLIYINDVPNEYKEYVMGRISKNSSGAILNLYKDRTITSNVSFYKKIPTLPIMQTSFYLLVIHYGV